MLPAKFRLVNKNDIAKVYRRGKSFFSSFFRVSFLPNQIDNNRFAFVIPNKVIKKASKRNLLKRKLRSAVYDYIGKKELREKPRLDMVIGVIKEPAAPYDYHQIKENIEICLKKPSLL